MKFEHKEYQIESKSRNCFFSCLTAALAQIGIIYDEYELYILCNGIINTYNPLEDKEKFGKLDIATVIENSPIFQNIDLHRLMCPLSKEAVKKVLDDDNYVMCVIKVKDMSFNEECAKVTHLRRHIFLIQEIDFTNNKCLILDKYYVDLMGKIKEYSKWVDFNDLFLNITQAFYLEKTDDKIIDVQLVLEKSLKEYINSFDDLPYKGSIAYKKFFHYLIEKYTLEAGKELVYLIKLIYIIPSIFYIQKFLQSKENTTINEDLDKLEKSWTIFCMEILRNYISNKVDIDALKSKCTDLLDRYENVLKYILKECSCGKFNKS